MTENAEEPVVREYRIGNTIYRVKVKSNGQTQEEPNDTIKRLIQRNTRCNRQIEDSFIKKADKRQWLCYLISIQALPV